MKKILLTSVFALMFTPVMAYDDVEINYSSSTNSSAIGLNGKVSNNYLGNKVSVDVAFINSKSGSITCDATVLTLGFYNEYKSGIFFKSNGGMIKYNFSSASVKNIVYQGGIFSFEIGKKFKTSQFNLTPRFSYISSTSSHTNGLQIKQSGRTFGFSIDKDFDKIKFGLGFKKSNIDNDLAGIKTSTNTSTWAPYVEFKLDNKTKVGFKYSNSKKKEVKSTSTLLYLGYNF